MAEIRTITKEDVYKPVGPDRPKLRASIDASGVLERPLCVLLDNGMLEAVRGRGRILETIFGNYLEIEVEVIPESELSSEMRAVSNLASNHSHSDNLAQDAEDIRDLIEGNEEKGMLPRSQTQAARETGMSLPKINQLYGIFRLHPLLVDKIMAGLMGIGASSKAQRLPELMQQALGEKDGRITVSDVVKLLNELKAAVIEEAGQSDTANEQAETDETPRGLLISMDDLDLLKMGMPITVNIDGQQMQIQVVG